MCGVTFKLNENIYVENIVQEKGVKDEKYYQTKYSFVPAHGYEISPKLALKLAEFYRENVPKSNGKSVELNSESHLTKTARLILSSYSNILDSRSEINDLSMPFYSYR